MSLWKKDIQISVVVPAYNVEKYLEEMIISILKQTILPHEIIIVEDCSDDDTYSIAMQLAENTDLSIKVYRQEKNSGVSAARNKGIELAQSEWILFMDADDIAEAELIERESCRICELQKEWTVPVVLVHSAYRQITESGQPLGIHRWKQVDSEEILGYELIRNQVVSTTGVLVKKSAVIQAGWFDTKLRYSEDWDLWLKLAQIGGYGYVNEPLVRVRRHIGNTSAKLANMLGGEKVVLSRYDISFIETAIHKRHLPYEVNRADYIALLYRIERWEDGFLFVNELIKKYPNLAIGYFLASLYYIIHRDWDKAKQLLVIAIEHDSKNGAALNNLGAVLMMLGEDNQAKELFEKAILFFPGYIDAMHNLNVIEIDRVLSVDEIKFTWRVLRPVLLSYTG